ncbi:hypothetical protein G6F31_014066 [Rhizopus arrhizus]|nr:hypothetical protein G6F31_014066 [Rhizopus arrhizus]
MGRQRQADADGAQYAPVPEARPRAAAAEDRRMEFPKVVADRPVRAAAGLGDPPAHRVSGLHVRLALADGDAGAGHRGLRLAAVRAARADPALLAGAGGWGGGGQPDRRRQRLDAGQPARPAAGPAAEPAAAFGRHALRGGGVFPCGRRAGPDRGVRDRDGRVRRGHRSTHAALAAVTFDAGAWCAVRHGRAWRRNGKGPRTGGRRGRRRGPGDGDGGLVQCAGHPRRRGRPAGLTRKRAHRPGLVQHPAQRGAEGHPDPNAGQVDDAADQRGNHQAGEETVLRRVGRHHAYGQPGPDVAGGHPPRGAHDCPGQWVDAPRLDECGGQFLPRFQPLSEPGPDRRDGRDQPRRPGQQEPEPADRQHSQQLAVLLRRYQSVGRGPCDGQLCACGVWALHRRRGGRAAAPAIGRKPSATGLPLEHV